MALEHPRFGSLRPVNSPIEVAGCEKVKPTAAPELGEHTTEVLRELGYSKEEIERLLSKGVMEQFAG